jgi:hypothetical protein
MPGITGYKRLALERKMWVRRLMPQIIIIFFYVVIVVVVVVVVVVVLVAVTVEATASRPVAISTIIS